MLTKLSIKNYALIENLSVDFHDGFSIITGETGAGKSILLGALGLVLGNRADTTYLKNTDQKCIIESEFSIEKYDLESFFEEEDLDFEPLTIIRREILPSGKSRAFINDTPTTLSVLKLLSEKLIDIHSQHQTLELSDSQYQFKIIDILAANKDLITDYKKILLEYNSLKRELKELLDSQENFKQQYEYNLHLFEELDLANIADGELVKIESELEIMNNVESIKLNLEESLQLNQDEEFGLSSLISLLKSKIGSISNYSEKYTELFQRIESVEIELKDIVVELENLNESITYSKTDIDNLNERVQLIYDLFKKHNVLSERELLEIKESLFSKVELVQNSPEIVSKKESELNQLVEKLNKFSATIHQNRKKVIPVFVSRLQEILENLGMQNSRFKIELSKSPVFLPNGTDEVKLLYSANKGTNFGELKKIASGGELSRIMLAVKSILSSYMSLPSIIFDEIDSGVSGEISNKMADIMKQMSQNMQVISITHLPQVAAKGKYHYKVFKEDIDNNTVTQLKLLNTDERVEEIAEIIGGKRLSDSALAHAKELLN